MVLVHIKTVLTRSTQIGVAHLMGARVDVAISELAKGHLGKPYPEQAQKIIKSYDEARKHTSVRGEL